MSPAVLARNVARFQCQIIREKVYYLRFPPLVSDLLRSSFVLLPSGLQDLRFSNRNKRLP